MKLRRTITSMLGAAVLALGLVAGAGISGAEPAAAESTGAGKTSTPPRPYVTGPRTIEAGRTLTYFAGASTQPHNGTAFGSSSFTLTLQTGDAHYQLKRAEGGEMA